jgi:diguanylate cyclase (GGDEF)-like protein/PAS domain S-box-containing protein
MQFQSTNKKLSPSRFHGLILGTALTVAAIVGANAIILSELHRDTLEDAQGDVLRQSLTLSELAERTIQSIDLVLASVAEKIRADVPADGDLKKLGGQSLYLFLNEKMSGLPQIATLGLLDAQGVRISHSRDWPSANVDLSRREYFQTIKRNPQSKSVVSEPVQGVGSGTWTMILARPLLTASGDFLGVVFGSTRLNYFDELFEKTSLGDGYAATLMRTDGTLLARFPKAGTIGAVHSVESLKKLGKARFALSRSVSPVDHQARIAAAYKLSGFPLVVIVTKSEDAAFAAWRATALMMSAITAAMVLLVGIAAYLIARSWKQQDRLNVAKAQIIESEKSRALAEAELKRQQDMASQNVRFNAAVGNMSQGLSMYDAAQRLIICNRQYAEIYRLTEEQTNPGTTLREILAYRTAQGTGREDYTKSLDEWVDEIVANKRHQGVSKLADGRFVSVIHRPMEGGGWISTHEDITEQRLAAQELDETKRFLDSIIENIPVAVVVKDAKTFKFALVNRQFEAMVGLPHTALIGKQAKDIYAAHDAALFDQADRQAVELNSGVTSAEYEVEIPARGTRVLATSRIVIRDKQDEPKYLALVIEDITERKRSEQRIAFMAHHDALTGLANRAAAVEKIEDAGARQRRWGQQFTVLLLDLDRFKYVNDTLGHPAGDALLRETAVRLKGTLRETDVLARLGGDEFAIIQIGEGNQREAAVKLANRVIDLIAQPFNIEGNEVNIATSIGIALAPEHASRPDSLLKMADMALYRAKSAGRNGFCFFDPEMSAAASVRHELETELRRAIQQDQFELYYQPIIDSKTRKICGAEALVRWNNPTKGMISPEKFIPLAEESGLITQIGEWVLQTACAEAVKWPSHVRVSVNLSPVQLRRRDLVDIVICALAQSGLPPERLELEVTETALIESATDSLTVLRQLKNLGVSIALDDFGTGYSSLSHLTMFPFDKIKIDKSFTQNLTKRADCAIIISATLTLARGLDISTTAEGVETADQFRLLRMAGVTSVQGYLFYKPIAASEIDFNGVCSDPEINHAA